MNSAIIKTKMKETACLAALILVVLLIGVACLVGCAAGGVSGKTLYFVSPDYKYDGDIRTIVFDDTDGWHYVNGSKELSGTWSEEGDNIVLKYSNGLGTLTLEKVDGQNAYQPLGKDYRSERYFLSEQDAQAWHDEYIATAPERVTAILESAAWDTSELFWLSDGAASDRVAVSPNIAFEGGNVTYANVVIDENTLWSSHRTLSEGSWVASNHVGPYTIAIDEVYESDSFTYSYNSAYVGTIDTDDGTVDFRLEVGASSVGLRLDNYVSFSADI